VEKRDERDLPDQTETGLIDFLQELSPGNHLDFPLFLFQFLTDSPLKTMQPVYPVKGQDDPAGRHPPELPQNRASLFRRMEMVKKTHGKHAPENRVLERQAGFGVGDGSRGLA
jgi:hypothetical protein